MRSRRFRAAVKQWPADASLYHELAVVARELGRADEALRAEEAALALDRRAIPGAERQGPAAESMPGATRRQRKRSRPR